MNDGDGDSGDDYFARVMLTNPNIARLTPVLIEEVLEGFALAPMKDVSWIARAVQAAVYVGSINGTGWPDRKGNAEVRDDLDALAKRANGLWRDLFELDGQSEDALWRYAFDGRAIELDTENEEALPMGQPTQIAIFNEAVRALELLPGILARAAVHIGNKTQTGPWRAGERMNRRIEVAKCLSPVFETAFGHAATPLNGAAAPYGPWGDFFQRIMAAALAEQATPNLETVLKLARRRSLQSPVLFAPGIMPD